MDPLRSIRYLTPSELDDGWQFTCVDVGSAEVAPGSPYPPWPGVHPPEYAKTLSQGRVLTEYQLIFLSQGSGTLTIRDRTWSLGPGDAFLLFPGERHTYAPDSSTGWVEHWAGFRGSYPDTLVKKGFFDPREPVYPGGLGPSALADFHLLIEEVTAEEPGFRLLAASRIMGLLARLVASRRVEKQESGTALWFERIRLILEDRVTDHEIDWLELARAQGLSYQTFSSRFHGYSGLPPHQYWLGLKLARAKQHLRAGRSVKETSFQVGFDNEFYFSRFFKKRTGVPPSRWSISG